MSDINDEGETRELETLMRRGLAANAERVDVTDAGRLVDRTQRIASRGWRIPLLAAAAVVALVSGGLVVGHWLSTDDGLDPAADQASAQASDRVTDPPVLPKGWRTEYWRTIAVDVPADWGYGGAPYLVTGEPDSLAACAPSAMVRADGTRDWAQQGPGADGYVGRPIMLTDACQGYQVEADFTPPGPYLWFDADIDEGTVRFDGGFVQQTMTVDGVKVTVGSADGRLREQILDSARGETLCASTVDAAAEQWLASEAADGEITSMRACAYRVDRSRPGTVTEPQLSTAVQVEGAATERYLGALRGREVPRDQCPRLDVDESEWVVLELLDDTGAVQRRDVIHLAGSCAGVDVGARGLANLSTSKLTPSMVRPWAVASIPATVYGPSGGKGALLESFIGTQG